MDVGHLHGVTSQSRDFRPFTADLRQFFQFLHLLVTDFSLPVSFGNVIVYTRGEGLKFKLIGRPRSIIRPRGLGNLVEL